MAKILICEDELHINNLIKMNLTLVGHTCHQVYRGDDALNEIKNQKFDLLILDIMLPGVSGTEVFKQVKNTPTIFVTAKGTLQDRLNGLNLGADDYIVKPFEMLELIARVDAVLRRTLRENNRFAFDDIEIDFDSKIVYKGGKEVELKPKEYDLFEALVRNRNLALSREKLIEIAWDFDYGTPFTEKTVQTILDMLRPEYIKGLTLLGGEPFEPQNQGTIVDLLRRIKTEMPEKSIWAFSGYLFEKITSGTLGEWEITEEFISYLDVLVDGPFVEEKKNLNLRFRGSENQRLIDVPASLKAGAVILWKDKVERGM